LLKIVYKPHAAMHGSGDVSLLLLLLLGVDDNGARAVAVV
jgi:hypothetical protein